MENDTPPVKAEYPVDSGDSNEVVAKPEPLDASSISHIPDLHATQSDQFCHGSDVEGAGKDNNEHRESRHLERLCTENSLDVLEAGVSAANELLDQLRDALDAYPDPEVDTWIESIDDFEKYKTPTRTVVGVVGNTGAGKSSVINAVLDEERLLPTNCLRACTASPTEISFNYSDDPDALYQAEIEFITAEDWTRELQVLFSDLLDGSGQVCREATKSDTDAGIAYAKVKAVYPKKTREMLAQADPKRLADEPAVRGILGTTKLLKEATAKQLYRKMQHYVDSKEKSTGPADQGKKDTAMEYWPLIKVVRIFTKASALSTGAVIVDLPGVQDSNAARAAVAANYMKSCTGLWIVAPITRAVDDKTAKSLLGDSFKRQLKYDGTYSAVSFICSKTDDISITEAAESLGLEAETAESWDAAEKMLKSKKSLQSQISDLKETKDALGQELDDCEAETDIWEELQSQITSGETVYEQPTGSKKRKRSGTPPKNRKRSISEGNSDQDSDIDSSDKENSQSQRSRKPLTEENVDERLSSLRTQRKRIRGERRSLDNQISGLRQEIKEIQSEREKILAKIKAICIQGRNAYSRGAIKQDFAMGIKELDQENAVEEDDENFDPDQDIRDYEEVASSLPVFCVSSRAYQKLSGRLEKDDFQSHGFLSVEDTEVPQLQEHARKLTKGSRLNQCRRFMNELCQMVNSIKLWAANDGTSSHLTGDEKRREEQHLKKLLDHLEEELSSVLKASIDLIRTSLGEHIFENIGRYIPLAIEVAPSTAFSWGAHRSEGGLYWATYKATVRRQGVYSGASGPRDFNQELFDPISRNLATGWERAFQRRLPAILDDFAKEAVAKLQNFHQAAKARAEQRQTHVPGLHTLSNQIQAHMRTIQSLPENIKPRIIEIQREASRQFTPVICNMMTNAYTICTDEHGAGSYARMKDAMNGHVDMARHSMFHEATNVVKTELETMCRIIKKVRAARHLPDTCRISEPAQWLLGELEEVSFLFPHLTYKQDIGESVDAVFDTIFEEYMRTLVGTEVDRSKKMSREELDTRLLVNKILLRGDKLFASVLGEPEEDDNLDEVTGELTTDNSDGNSILDNVTETPQDLASQADDLIQAAIRQSMDPQVADDDPFASDDDDDEFPDVMDLVKVKKERPS